MGQLFKEYGKPAMLGVGHVKQELKKQATEEPVVEVVDPNATPVPPEAKGNKPLKVKAPKAKGPKK